MNKIFISGPCRLLSSFGYEYNNKVYALNSMDHNFIGNNFIGNNFMGKLHTQKMIIKLKKAYQNFHSNKSKIV